MLEDILSRVKEADLEDFRVRVNETERAYENLFVNVSSETINEIIDRKLNQENMSFVMRGEPIETSAGKATVIESGEVPKPEEIKKEVRDDAALKKFLDTIRG